MLRVVVFDFELVDELWSAIRKYNDNEILESRCEYQRGFEM